MHDQFATIRWKGTRAGLYGLSTAVQHLDAENVSSSSPEGYYPTNLPFLKSLPQPPGREGMRWTFSRHTLYLCLEWKIKGLPEPWL